MTETEHFSRPQTLPDYVAILRRRKWLILQCLVLVPAVALVISLTQAHLYRATADVLLSQQNLAAQVSGIQDPTAFQDPIRFAQTQAAMARLPAVAKTAVAHAGVRGSKAGDLLAHSSVTADANANLLHFSLEDASRATAVRLVNAYASAFTRFQDAVATAAVERARTQLDDRLAQLREQHQQGSALYANLQTKEQQLRTLELLQTSNSLTHPAASAAEVRPRTKRNVALGILAGIVLGLTFALVWDSLDRRIRSEEEIEHILGQPVLARLARPSRGRQRADQLATVIAPHSAEAEAYRRLRTTLEFANSDIAAQTIMITSAVKREGKSTMVANLGISLAQSGRHVVLVDLDLRQRALTTAFDLDGVPGVADVVGGRARLDQALASVAYSRQIEASSERTATNGDSQKPPLLLEVLPAGLLLPTDPSSLVASETLTKLLAQLASNADLVLIDAPPLLAVAEAMVLAAKVQGLVTVSRVDVVSRPALRELAQTLATVSTAKLGVVITGSSHGSGYGYAPYEYVEPRPTASRTPLA